MPSISQQEGNALLRTVNSNSLLNRQLQSICSAHGLARGGVKADLQRRVSSLVRLAIESSNVRLFRELQRQIQGQSNRSSPSVPPPSLQTGSYPSQPPAMPQPGGYGQTPSAAAPAWTSLAFKSSPFYEVVSRIGEVRPCDVMCQHRNTVNITIRAQDHPDIVDLVCRDSKKYRIMVFCAAEPSGPGPQDISFPHQSELRINTEDVRANLRGLKNKPGSTRPVDITSLLRLRSQSYPNTLTFTYALTTKQPYYLVVQVCKAIRVEELVERIKGGPKITKAQVITEMKSKASDPDIEATSSVLSLKCPLSYMRLSLPCRGIACTHLQCFDATSYLQLQEQGPQWVCPVCNKQAAFEHLAVDEYVQDILSNAPADLEQVTIEPDGRWRVQRLKKDNVIKKAPSVDVLDDLEISEVKPRYREHTPARGIPSIGTPSTAASRKSTAFPRPASLKRPAPDVIDLTFDDSDEGDVGQRPAKRQQLDTLW